MTDEDHNLESLDCWCCPVVYDPDTMRVLSREEATYRMQSETESPVLIVHRSEEAEANDFTGPIPWQAAPTEGGE